MKTVLFQPRYPHGKSQVYLPGGLMNLGSRLIRAGIEVSFFDLNLTVLDSVEVCTDLVQSDIIGFSVLGHPYIPIVIENIKMFRARGFSQRVLVGGEGVVRLQTVDFLRWFGVLGDVVQIKNIKAEPNHGIVEDADLRHALGISELASQFETSMTPMLKRLPEPTRRAYLTSEFSLFLSNGCKFPCEFCSADKNRTEQYRTIDSVRDEIEYICWYFKSIEHTELRIYLSNLDAFQNPKQLEPRLKAIADVCRMYHITPHVRCLATSRCTFQAVDTDRGLPKRLHSFGLRVVAFGADGADEETWKREGKLHNKLSEINDVVLMMQRAGILVELLMVIGFQKDKLKALWHDICFSFRKAREGAVIRPYLGKSRTPSAPGRWMSGQKEVEACRRNPKLLLHLDFAMIASRVSHPSLKERWLSTLTYLCIIIGLAPLGLCPTRPLMPVPQKGIGKVIAQTVNRLMPFDR